MPFIIVNYDVHHGSSLMLPTYTFSVLPETIQLAGPEDEAHDIILSTAHNTYQFRNIGGTWTRNKENIHIPLNSTVVDVRELVGNDEMKKKEMFYVPQRVWKNNALNFYFGMDALKLTETHLNDENNLIKRIREVRATYQKNEANK